MFNKILIANRGEIACRIIKTARTMGIQTVAVYSTADQFSLHVCLADSAYCLGEAPAKESYLNIEKIIEVAKKSGAEAIHPGYGFLSENSEFAQICSREGIIFIGPSASAMEAMASKQLSKKLLEKSSVPLTPGYHGSDQSEKKLRDEAVAMGFPILIKAAHGGGGKGMRAVYDEAEFDSALAGAKREALASFANDTMILEKLICRPRHIEIQIMADNHGNVVHLFERDCSIQRRHQKIIEEAPAPNLSPRLRHNLAQAACEVARAIHYSGAGTVEFLVDEAEHFYFMEMNTRLQVEHPVTEMITGLDLVEWQLKIAANEILPLSQDAIEERGHAIECRIYAEDPSQNFIPSIGQIHFLKEPSGQGIRIDTGVTVHSQITRYYDPMIAKLIAFGTNREEAQKRLLSALDNYFIGGVKTNIPFLKAICQHPLFIQTLFNTDFLATETIELEQEDMTLALLLAVSFDYTYTVRQINDPLLKDCFSWQGGDTSYWINRYLKDEKITSLTVFPMHCNQFRVVLDEQEYVIQTQLQRQQLFAEINGQNHQALVENTPTSLVLHTKNGVMILERYQWNTFNSQHSNSLLTAPMTSTVVALLKKAGDLVKQGEGLMILEAMKMEHTIYAPYDGALTEFFYSEGMQVNEGELLLSLNQPNAT